MANDAVIVAYRNSGQPVARNGRLAIFDTIQDARDAAGALGVGVAIRWIRAAELCVEHGLELPSRPENDQAAQLRLAL